MADYQTIRTANVGARSAEIDAGLRAHMNKVYGLMSAGMLLTAGVAWSVGTSDVLLSLFTSKLVFAACSTQIKSFPLDVRAFQPMFVPFNRAFRPMH